MKIVFQKQFPQLKTFFISISMYVIFTTQNVQNRLNEPIQVKVRISWLIWWNTV
jgi:hypothetical protein